MAPRLYVRVRNGSGALQTIPLRYLVPSERADLLERATTPLE